jgi:hypothetical protein
MHPVSFRTMSRLNRRTALATVSAGGLGLALAGRSPNAAAQDANATALADHPLTGDWLAIANQTPGAPQVPAPSHFGADGSVLLVFPPTQAGQQGVAFVSPPVVTWEADSDRRGHFTATQLLSDATGAFLGSVTVDGYPEVSEDGQSFVDDGAKVMITIRDATGSVVQQMPGAGGPPVTGIRMAPGTPGFPAGTAGTATPTT